MDKQNILSDIILFPKLYHNQLDKSIYSMLKESGYFEIHNEIRVSDFIKALEEKSENIEYWLTLSENKRTTGWFFKKNNEEKYTVGYFSMDHDGSHSKEYQDAKEACANFIKSEIEDIRMN